MAKKKKTAQKLKGRTTPPGACGSAWEARCITDDPKGFKWDCNIFPKWGELQVCATATIDTSKKPAQIVFKDVK